VSATARSEEIQMRLSRFAAALAGLICLTLSFPLFAEDDTVEWLNNYKEAIQEAQRTHKPIFLEYRCEP
jgi:hypothetical protein